MYNLFNLNKIRVSYTRNFLSVIIDGLSWNYEILIGLDLINPVLCQFLRDLSTSPSRRNHGGIVGSRTHARATIEWMTPIYEEVVGKSRIS